MADAENEENEDIVALLEEHLDSKFPLHAAARTGDVEAMTQLLDGGAEVDAKKDGATALLVACEHGHVDAARLLLEKGAEVDRAMEDGWTPLLIACQEGHVDMARLLLEKGADVNRASMKGTTPLDAAKKEGHSSIVALIEDHLYKADSDATAPVARGENLANMMVGRLQSARDAEAARKRQRLVPRPLKFSKEERTPRREWVGDSFVI